MARSWTEAFDLGDGVAPPESAPADEETRRTGVFRRLRESLSRSRQALHAELSSSLFEQLDDETWERLEEALILADVGAKTTADVVGGSSMRSRREAWAAARRSASASWSSSPRSLQRMEPGSISPSAQRS